MSVPPGGLQTGAGGRSPSGFFDDWADDYNADVAALADAFPFAGYADVLHAVAKVAVAAGARRVFDLGIGTGALSAGIRVADPGVAVWGVDASPRMLMRAAARVPGAILVEADLRGGLRGLDLPRFGAVVSTYVLHELPDDDKVRLLVDAAPLLEPGGAIVVGDIAFPDAAALRRARNRTDGWDEDEHYAVADALLPRLAAHGLSGDLRSASWCAGIFELRPDT